METCCKNCIFAKYEDITQTGCERGMLDAYEKTSSTIIPAYDEDSEFFVVQNRLCPFYRTNEWIAAIQEASPNQDNTELIEDMLKFETTLSYYIFAEDIMSSDELQKLCQTLIESNIRPFGLCVSNKSSNKSITKQDFLDLNLPFRWDLTYTDEPLSFVIRNKIRNSKQHYVVILHSKKLQPDSLSVINNGIINKTIQFTMVDDDELCLIPAKVYNTFYTEGDFDIPVRDKLTEYAKHQERKTIWTKQEILNF